MMESEHHLEELRDLIASNVSTAIELRRTADAIGKLAAHYEASDVQETTRNAKSLQFTSRLLAAVAGVLTLLILAGWGSVVTDLGGLKESQQEKQVWMDDQMGVSEAIIKGMAEVNAQLKARGMAGIDSFVKTAKENQEHARSIVDKSRHVRR